MSDYHQEEEEEEKKNERKSSIRRDQFSTDWIQLGKITWTQPVFFFFFFFPLRRQWEEW